MPYNADIVLELYLFIQIQQVGGRNLNPNICVFLHSQQLPSQKQQTDILEKAEICDDTHFFLF